MKNVFLKSALALAVFAGLFTSCSSDDNNGPTSTFVVTPEDFRGNINDGEVVLNANTVYTLTGPLVVNDGATLTIPAGTVIEATGGTAAYIAVAQGGKIFVNGTASNPVVMTSGLATPAAGNWGGLVICGKAPINTVSGGASTAQSEVAGLTYGGSIANDNSGSVRYLVIEYAGAAFSSTKEFNGASLFGVGSGTTFEYVQALNGADDGFEFFGGTVNTSNLVSFGNQDDQFDWTEGWSGTNNNWYGKISFGQGNRGIEADNYEFGFANTPVSNPTINNITLVGAGPNASSQSYAENQAMKLRRGTRASFTNVVLADWATGIDIEHNETLANIPGSLSLTTVLFTNITTKSKGKDTAGATVSVTNAFTEGAATGAGNGAGIPTWAQGWTNGLN
ncbi:hypothetical protein [Flavobacterium aurantiibacter]|uniref:Multidrug transporter n=1 Tax=Flavobacterium aurantiibacter TaxID=2023067 RepID=A0A255ZS96_9FLAO|nr:hypothetical protein [Flavobacterium aurantiibacter]OYQ43794.1 hypothetical protein CHX27_08920 [Flavobacterium aurantiibacter]